MTTLTAPAPTSTLPPKRRWRELALVLAGAVAASNTAVMRVVGGPRALVVLPLAALVGVGLLRLAWSRLSVFVLVVLVVRSSLDVARLGSGDALLNPASLLGLLFSVTAILWLCLRRRERVPHRMTFAEVGVLAYFGACFLSLFTSESPYTSATEVARILAAVSMFLVVDRLLATERDARRVMAAILASAVVPLLVAMSGLALGFRLTETKDQLQRLTSTFSQSNPFGHFLVVLIVAAVALLPHVVRRHQVVLGVLLAGMLPALLLTYTRGAWIGLIVGLVVVGIVDNRALLAVLVVGILLVLVAVPSVTGRVTEIGSNPYPDQRLDSLAWRFHHWGEVLPLANGNPITGIGLKVTAQKTDKLPHNDYVRAYVETGVIGLLAYVLLLAALVVTGWRALRRSPHRGFRRGVAVGFLAYAVAFAVVSGADNLSSQVVVLWYIFAFAAVANWVARTGDAVPVDVRPELAEAER
jgi:O-antigen ligase